MKHPTSLVTIAAIGLLPLLTSATPGHLLNFNKVHYTLPSQQLATRSPIIDGDNLRHGLIYSINVTIGNPPQSATLWLDTGSSDTWVSSKDLAYCPIAQHCEEVGVYSHKSSITYKPTEEWFEIMYADHSEAFGPFFKDDLGFDDFKLRNVQMAEAVVWTDDGPPANGLMGIGYTENESFGGFNRPYPTVIDEMKRQNMIKTHAYSLWLDDLESSTGSVLFGAIDTSKFTGELALLPVVQAPGHKDLSLQFSSLTFSGSDVHFPLHETIVMDSGASDVWLPDGIVQNIYDFLEIDGPGSVNCSSDFAGRALNFTLGANNEFSISIPASQFLVKPQGIQNPPAPCRLGIRGGEVNVAGDPLLRALYVVYDLEHDRIALAPSNFNPGPSQIVEITESDFPLGPGGQHTSADSPAFQPSPPAQIPLQPFAPMPPSGSASPSANRRVVLALMAAIVVVVLVTPCLLLVAFEVGETVGFGLAQWLVNRSAKPRVDL